jgi:hypothetical protein
MLEELKDTVQSCFGVLGLQITRIDRKSPVTGTFPRHTDYSRTGNPQDYFIRPGYRHRTEAIYFDDRGNTDKWQRRVYRFAREVFDQHRLKVVCDLGCGSAYKLVRYFGDCNPIGMDVATTCVWLKKKYPRYTWMELDFKAAPPLKADLVIAADVIEHLLDPNALLSYISSLEPKYVVLSTPDRNLLPTEYDGPPTNRAHIREWSFLEFETYVSSRFDVLEHFISNAAQATQCVLCSPHRS